MIEFTADQRNVVRDQIIERVEIAVNDLLLLAELSDCVEATRLSGESRDDLLVLDHLGWERKKDGGVCLEMPPEILRRVLSRHCHFALLRDASEVVESDDSRWNAERNEFLIRTLSRALAELDQWVQSCPDATDM